MPKLRSVIRTTWTGLTLCEAVRVSQDRASWSKTVLVSHRTEVCQSVAWPQRLLTNGQEEEEEKENTQDVINNNRNEDRRTNKLKT